MYNIYETKVERKYYVIRYRPIKYKNGSTNFNQIKTHLQKNS